MVPPTVGSCRVRPQDSAIAVLRFKDVMERAERASSLVSLGSFHTVRLVDRFMHCKCPGKKCECCPTTNQCRVFRVTDIESCGRDSMASLEEEEYVWPSLLLETYGSNSIRITSFVRRTLNHSFSSDDNDTSWYMTYEETTFVQVSPKFALCWAHQKWGPLHVGPCLLGRDGHHHTY